MHCRQSLSSCRTRVILLLVAIFSLISIATAATPTSFCKCTCFSNSTIIPLDASKSSSGDGDHKDALRLYERTFNPSLDPQLELADKEIVQPDESDEITNPEETVSDVLVARAQTYRALTCNDCNRKFCLDYKLPICKDAKEEDVFTMCFQRDSRKDQAVVFIFIFATGGLLLWALVKPWVERYIEAARERRSYMPVGESEGS